MDKNSNKTNEIVLATYLFVASGITWMGWIPVLVFGMQPGFSIPNFNSYAALLESGYTMSTISVTFIYVWFYNQTHRNLLTILFHCFSNKFNDWFSPLIPTPEVMT